MVTLTDRAAGIFLDALRMGKITPNDLPQDFTNDELQKAIMDQLTGRVSWQEFGPQLVEKVVNVLEHQVPGATTPHKRDIIGQLRRTLMSPEELGKVTAGEAITSSCVGCGVSFRNSEMIVYAEDGKAFCASCQTPYSMRCKHCDNLDENCPMHTVSVEIRSLAKKMQETHTKKKQPQPARPETVTLDTETTMLQPGQLDFTQINTILYQNEGNWFTPTFGNAEFTQHPTPTPPPPVTRRTRRG